MDWTGKGRRTVHSISAVRSSTAGGVTGVDPSRAPGRFFRAPLPDGHTGDRQLRVPDGSERGPPSRAHHGKALQDSSGKMKSPTTYKSVVAPRRIDISDRLIDQGPWNRRSPPDSVVARRNEPMPSILTPPSRACICNLPASQHNVPKKMTFMYVQVRERSALPRSSPSG